jgi:hypothetical protein
LYSKSCSSFPLETLKHIRDDGEGLNIYIFSLVALCIRR